MVIESILGALFCTIAEAVSEAVPPDGSVVVTVQAISSKGSAWVLLKTKLAEEAKTVLVVGPIRE